MPTCTSWRRRSAATIAASARRWTCSISRRRRSARSSGIRRAGSCIARSEAYMRRRLDAAGYQEVKTPQLVDRVAVGRSGHWEKFRAAHVHRPGGGRGQNLALKPMNCPCHVPDLPAGPAVLSRAAAAHGGVRLLPPLRAVGRAARHHAGAGVHPGRRAYLLHRGADRRRRRCASSNCCRSIYRDFGFPEFRVKFSDRPDERVGTDEVWDHAEAALQEACATAGVEYTLNPGEGAFYGPKLEFVLRDAIGRDWQCGTLQVDFNTAGAAGRRICRRGRRRAPPGDAAPRHPGQLRALPGHRDRALCRPLPAVAGAGAGGGGDDRLRCRRLRRARSRRRWPGPGWRCRPT